MGVGTREPRVAPEKPRRDIFSCCLETIAKGCRAPGIQRPRIWEAPLWNCVSTQPGELSANPSPESQMCSVGTRPPLRAWQGLPPCLPGLGRAPFGPSLQSSLKSDLFSCLSSSQPHEAFRSFLSGSGAGSPVLTCAQTVAAGQAGLSQWQRAANAPEALRRQGKQGGPGAWRGRSSRAEDRPRGRVKAQHLCFILSVLVLCTTMPPGPTRGRPGGCPLRVHQTSMSRPRTL